MAAFPQIPSAPMVGQDGRLSRAFVEWMDRLRAYLASLDVLEDVADLQVIAAELEAMAGGLRTAVAQAQADIAALNGRATALEGITGTHTTQITSLTAADTALSARVTDLEVLSAWP